MLRFTVYRNGAPADEIDLSGAYVFGQDGIPVRADLAAGKGQITCIKRIPGACGLAVLWDAGEPGRVLLGTTRLPERSTPYNLNLELARAQMARIAQKREDWGLFDYGEADELNAQWDEARTLFVNALQAPDPPETAALADRALEMGVTLGEKMALFHAETFLKRRRSSGPQAATRTGFGCQVDLFSVADGYHEALKEAFDFVTVPMPWKHIEPKEHAYQYAQTDAWVNWAVKARKPIHAGPLLSFAADNLPDWMYIWEHDYETLRDVIYEHLQRVVTRYEKHVPVWNVVSGIHAHNNFNLTFEQLMELTRMSCLLVKKLAPQSKVMIELVLPWGEYYARNQRTIPPLLYADMAVQSGIKFDLFGVQLYMGVPEDGYYVRDLLQVSSLLDEFVSLGKSCCLSACQAPSDVTPDPWDAWSGELAPGEAGHWHAPWSQRLQAEWLQAVYRTAISKPYVESICWRDLADYEGHTVPHGGLCTGDLEAKLAYRELRNFRAWLASSARGNGGARSRKTRPGNGR